MTRPVPSPIPISIARSRVALVLLSGTYKMSLGSSRTSSVSCFTILPKSTGMDCCLPDASLRMMTACAFLATLVIPPASASTFRVESCARSLLATNPPGRSGFVAIRTALSGGHSPASASPIGPSRSIAPRARARAATSRWQRWPEMAKPAKTVDSTGRNSCRSSIRNMPRAVTTASASARKTGA